MRFPKAEVDKAMALEADRENTDSIKSGIASFSGKGKCAAIMKPNTAIHSRRPVMSRKVDTVGRLAEGAEELVYNS